MKILLVNKFYYRRGGDCIYTLNLEHLLKSKGHEVAIFAMKHPENEKSKWSKYFPSEVKFKLGPRMLEAFMRPFGTREVEQMFGALLDEFGPDVIHLNNIHSQLSPTIAELAHERGIRVVWTLHDTKLVCPAYTCQRNGRWCDECFADKKAVLRHRCLPGSFIGAFIGWREILKWNKDRLQACTDMFLPPSIFLKDIMVKAGYIPNKFHVLCNFIDICKVKGRESINKADYYVFLGRIDDYKGIKTLCKTANILPYKLKVIGNGPLMDFLNDTYKNNSNIEFLGQLTWEELSPILAHAKFMVLPSECSENNPLTVIESQSLGTPVLGARIGGIPELIEEGVTGMTFESRNVADLKDKIQKMWTASWDYEAIARQSQERYNAEKYYEEIMKIYKC